MKLSIFSTFIFLFLFNSFGNQNDNLEYIISNYPDSILYDSSVSFNLVIRNKSDNLIVIKRMPNPIEIFFRKENESILLKQKFNDNPELTYLELGPKKEINQTIKFSTRYQNDTTNCPKPKKYDKTTSPIDQVLGNMIGLCVKINFEKPLKRGIYDLVIYVNITEKDDKFGYFRIIKKLRIK